MGEIRPVLLVLLTCISTACSVSFAYNNLDRFIRWQMSDYLDLSAAQRRYVNAEIAELLRWHRARHIPRYAAYLQVLALQFSDGVTEERIEALFAQLFLWGEEIQERSMPMVTGVLRSMSKEQMAALPGKLEASNLELAAAELNVPLSTVQADWAEGFEDFLSRFTGRLNRQQKAYLSHRAGAYQPERMLWAEYRRRWQADLIKLLVHRQEEQFPEQLRALARARTAYYGDEFTQVREANNALNQEVAAYLLSNLSERQSLRLAESLQELAEDLAQLAARAEKQEVEVLPP